MLYDHLLSSQYSSLWAIDASRTDWLTATFMNPPGAEAQSAAVSLRRAAESRSREGVAILPLNGLLVPRSNIFTEFGLATALDVWGAELRAVADSAVKAIVLDVNSPGGSVYGLAEAADDMAYARARKPVVAVANPMMASAAYYIGAQATEVVSTPSGLSGNIGVIYVHASFARQLEDAGVDVTVFSAGEFKSERHPALPLTDETRAAIQADINRMYSEFVNAVASGRGVTPADVRNGMGRGRALGASEAKAENVIDRVERIDATVERMQRVQARSAVQRRRAATSESIAGEVWDLLGGKD